MTGLGKPHRSILSGQNGGSGPGTPSGPAGTYGRAAGQRFKPAPDVRQNSAATDIREVAMLVRQYVWFA
jgi:hypothetical protein